MFIISKVRHENKSSGIILILILLSLKMLITDNYYSVYGCLFMSQTFLFVSLNDVFCSHQPVDMCADLHPGESPNTPEHTWTHAVTDSVWNVLSSSCCFYSLLNRESEAELLAGDDERMESGVHQSSGLQHHPHHLRRALLTPLIHRPPCLKTTTHASPPEREWMKSGWNKTKVDCAKAAPLWSLTVIHLKKAYFFTFLIELAEIYGGLWGQNTSMLE